ncbi:unnamed protein product, partial [Rotaria socialis]
GYVENDPKNAVTINDLTRLHPEMLSRGKVTDDPYLKQLENDRHRVQHHFHTYIVHRNVFYDLMITLFHHRV